MADEHEVGAATDLTPGTVSGAGPYAVGNSQGELFAVTRRCRHLRADLAGGSIDDDGCLVCPWHGAKYDVHSGRMTADPRGSSPRSLGWARCSSCSPGCCRSVAAR